MVRKRGPYKRSPSDIRREQKRATETREELMEELLITYGQWAVDIANKFIDDPEEHPYEERKRLAKIDKAFDF